MCACALQASRACRSCARVGRGGTVRACRLCAAQCRRCGRAGTARSCRRRMGIGGAGAAWASGLQPLREHAGAVRVCRHCAGMRVHASCALCGAGSELHTPYTGSMLLWRRLRGVQAALHARCMACRLRGIGWAVQAEFYRLGYKVRWAAKGCWKIRARRRSGAGVMIAFQITPVTSQLTSCTS